MMAEFITEKTIPLKIKRANKHCIKHPLRNEAKIENITQS